MGFPDHHPFRSSGAKERYLALNAKRAKDWPVPSETKTVDTEYGQTFVRISGPENADPLVLLHGLGVSSLSWTPNIEELSKNYRTYAVDTIDDWGLSVYKKRLKSSDDYTEWLDELFNGLGLENNINLAGISFGGMLACQYALRFPARLDKVIMIAPITIVHFSPLFLVRMPMALGGRYLFRIILNWVFKDSLQQENTKKFATELFLEDLPMAFRCFKVMYKPILLKIATDAELQRIKVPTLVLFGENEKLFSPNKAIKRLKKVAPDIETKLIQNAGHGVSLAQSEKVNEDIIQFISSPQLTPKV